MISREGKVLSVAILGGFVFGLVASAVSVDGVPLVDFFVQYNRAVDGGLYYQLFTSILVVIPFSSQIPLGLVDVLFNAMAVVFLDGLLSHAFRGRDYYAVFFASAVAGNVLSLLSGPSLVSFGASGGIFGLLAGAVAEEFAVEKRVDYNLLAWFVAVFIFSSFLLPYVDWLAHLGGAAFGLAAGYVVGIRRGAEPL